MTSAIVIDDDKDTVRLFSELLEENGVDVIGRGYSGKDAISLFEKRRPDVILIDIMMSEGSGFYAIRKIREKNLNAKILAVTADTTSLTEEKLKKISVDIIYKPFDMKQIISKINN